MMTDRNLKFVFSVVFAAMLVGAVPSSFAATPVQAVLACRSIVAAGPRLKCFDQASARLAAVHASRTATPVAAARPAPVAHAAAGARPAPVAAKRLSSEQAFGLSDSALTAHEVAVGALPKPLSHITATVLSIGSSADGRWIFSLSNGQVWVQDYANHDLLASRGQRVSISRQLFGSYWLQLPDGSGCKVQRVR